MSIMVDAFFSMDIFLSFRVAYFASDQKLERDNWQIAKRYMSTWSGLEQALIAKKPPDLCVSVCTDRTSHWSLAWQDGHVDRSGSWP